MGAYRVYSVEVIIQAFQAWARGSNPRARIESFCAGEGAPPLLHSPTQCRARGRAHRMLSTEQRRCG